MGHLKWLLLDLVCWVGATTALFYFNYPTIAAIVGGLGGMVMYKEILLFKQLQRQEIEQLMHEWGLINQRLMCLNVISSIGTVDIDTITHQVYNRLVQTGALDLIEIERCREIVAKVVPSLIEDGEVLIGEDGTVTLDPSVQEAVDLYRELLLNDTDSFTA